MEPGERITLIRRAAGTLHADEWSEINLVLRQFGIPTDYFIADDQYRYLIEQLEKGEDDDLLKLDAFLHTDAPSNLSPPPVEAGGPWEPGTFRLFLSHTYKHAREAADLRAILSRWGVDLFVAHDRIEPLAEWQGVIEDALRTCFAVAALVTPDFIESKWCDQEVGFALGRGVLVVPVMQPTPPYGLLGKFQGLRTGPTPLALAENLYARLTMHEQTCAQMAPVLVSRFTRSSTYDGARANWEKLKEVPGALWTREMAEEVRRAVTENENISAGNYLWRPFPDLLEEHLAQVGFPSAKIDDDDLPF